ncbi:hypothetical protein [Methanobacterium oryzae]|uniref:hypothetical protein n=1 Tax=Methanobacterium oryzae TaxID=69540 RepID=UPI003D1F6903
MNNNKALPLLLGIALTLLSLAFYLGFKPLNLFWFTMAILGIIFRFCTENRKIKVTNGYIVSVFSVNIVQWLILIYVFYYTSVYNRNAYLIDLIAALCVTLFLVNQIRKKYLKSTETKIDILKDKTKLILLSIGLIIIIGSLAGLITYYAPIFLYGVTLGLMVFVYGFYHEKRVSVPEKRNIANMYIKKDNIPVNYAKAMGSVIILQWIILIYFFHQISKDDWVSATTFSLIISLFFYIQIRESDLKYIGRMREKPTVISNKKKK